MDEVKIAASIAYRPSKINDSWDIRSQSDLDTRAEEMRALIRRWFSISPNKTIILSHETLASLSLDEVCLLFNLLKPLCDKIDVVVALRRQDFWMNSAYKNMVRNNGWTQDYWVNGMHKDRGRPKAGSSDNGWDYQLLLEKFESVFGSGRVFPFIFSDSDPEKRDLIEAFLIAAGLPEGDLDMTLQKAANESWDTRAIDVLRVVNREVPPIHQGRVTKKRKLIENAVMMAFQEKEFTFHIGTERAIEVLEIHADSNAYVAQHYFGRNQLFHEEFTIYDREVREANVEDFARVISVLAHDAARLLNSAYRHQNTDEDPT